MVGDEGSKGTGDAIGQGAISFKVSSLGRGVVVDD